MSCASGGAPGVSKRPFVISCSIGFAPMFARSDSKISRVDEPSLKTSKVISKIVPLPLKDGAAMDDTARLYVPATSSTSFMIGRIGSWRTPPG